MPAFAERARAIAAEYQSWGRVDDELRWAPGLCRIPLPGVARLSTSEDEKTHGQKLYSVFAKNRRAYPEGPHTDQVVVKEAWIAEKTDVPYDPTGYRPPPGPSDDHFYPYAEKDGVVYHAKERAGLYIMFKVEPATAETDAGWVYATITADGTLTAAGKVGACVFCHDHAKYDRLFGVPTGARPH